MTTTLSDSTWKYKNPGTNKEETFQILNTSDITRPHSLVLIPANHESLTYLCEKINNFKDTYNPPSATLTFDPSIEWFVFKTPNSTHLVQHFFLFARELGATEDVINTNPSK
ncbi:hypothetical protein OAJ27_00870 [bacterium]|nr:hypothetical protein [bacterium]